MKLVSRKTRKVLNKALRKHGPELIAALAGGALSRKVTDALGVTESNDSGKKHHAKGTKKRTGRNRRSDELSTETAK